MWASLIGLRVSGVLGFIEVILGLYWGKIGIMERKMETIGIIEAIGFKGL